MLISRICVLFLFALAQPFTAAIAVADSPCQDTQNNPCPPEPSPPAPAPDLVPSINSVSFGAGKVTVAMSINNQGNAAAVPTKTRIALFKPQGSGFATVAFHTQDVTLVALAPSVASSLSADVTAVLPKLYSRVHKICVTADAQAQVQENDEGNNTTCQQRQLLVTVAPRS